jgi:gamma-glutamyltranspeptidase/glutathione hydrolase
MRGVVVAPQPLAAEAGASILESGGNAFDAAIGAAFVQMITDPQMCGLGGFGCATYHLPPDHTEHVAFHDLDARAPDVGRELPQPHRARQLHPV